VSEEPGPAILALDEAKNLAEAGDVSLQKSK